LDGAGVIASMYLARMVHRCAAVMRVVACQTHEEVAPFAIARPDAEARSGVRDKCLHLVALKYTGSFPARRSMHEKIGVGVHFILSKSCVDAVLIISGVAHSASVMEGKNVSNQ
jgi:hypothetical protein